MNVNDFQNMHMQTIVGQMPLPQSIFRKFLNWLQGECASASDLDAKQNASDANLNTTVKTVVGGINETLDIATSAKTAALAALPADSISADSEYLYIKIGDDVFKVAATLVEEQQAE